MKKTPLLLLLGVMGLLCMAATFKISDYQQKLTIADSNLFELAVPGDPSSTGSWKITYGTIRSNLAAGTSNVIFSSGYRSTSVRPSRGLLFGDSLMSAYGSFNGVDTYLLSPADALMGTVISNQATPSHTIAQQLAIWEADTNKASYDWFGLMPGANNIDINLSPTNLIGQYQGLIDSINANKKSNAVIVVATLTPFQGFQDYAYDTTNGGGPTFPELAYQQWLTVNAAIMGGGATPLSNVWFRTSKHTYGLTAGRGYLAPFYNGDTLHENNAGRQVVAAAFREILNSAGYLENETPLINDSPFATDGTDVFQTHGTNVTFLGRITVGSLPGSGPIIAHSGGLLFATNASGILAVSDFLQVNLANIPITWFSNNWANYGGSDNSLVARKDRSSMLLYGTVNHPSGVTSIGQIVGRVPSGLEPASLSAQWLPTSFNDGTNYLVGSAALTPAGGIGAIFSSVAASGFVFFNGRYYCEDYFEAGTNWINSTNRSMVIFPVPFPAIHKLVHMIHYYNADEFTEFFRSAEGREVCRALLTNGWTLLCTAGQPSNWGNQFGITTHSNGLYWFTNTFATTQIVMFAHSMGGLAGVNLMAQNARVQRCYGLDPCLNLGHLYTNSAFTAAIETAFNFSGAGNYATGTSGYDPYRDIATNTLAGRRFRFVTSPSDTVVSQAGNANTWASKHTNTTTVRIVQSTGDHNDVAHYSATNVLAFFNEP